MSETRNTCPPKQLDGADVVCFTSFDGLTASGQTKHVINGENHQHFRALAIATYVDTIGCYLYYCDSAWMVLTDTYHATISDAKEQAEYEYPGTVNSWIDYQTTA